MAKITPTIKIILFLIFVFNNLNAFSLNELLNHKRQLQMEKKVLIIKQIENNINLMTPKELVDNQNKLTEIQISNPTPTTISFRDFNNNIISYKLLNTNTNAPDYRKYLLFENFIKDKKEVQRIQIQKEFDKDNIIFVKNTNTNKYNLKILISNTKREILIDDDNLDNNEDKYGMNKNIYISYP